MNQQDYTPQDQPMQFQFSQNASDEKTFGVLLPNGVYQLEIKKVEPGTSKSGNPKWTCYLEVLTPISRGGVQCAGQTLIDNITWTQKAENMVMRRLKAAGFAPQPGAPISLKPSDLIGRRVHAQVKTGEWQGTKRSEVDDWLPDAGPIQADGSASATQPAQQGEKPPF